MDGSRLKLGHLLILQLLVHVLSEVGESGHLNGGELVHSVHHLVDRTALAEAIIVVATITATITASSATVADVGPVSERIQLQRWIR